MEDYNKNYIDVKLSSETVYLYSVRKLLQMALDRNIHLFRGVLLDLGCGEMPYRKYVLDKNKNVSQYIGMDVDFNRHHQGEKPDMNWDGKKIEIGDSEVDTVMATELFEHIPNVDVVLGEIYRVIRKDGVLFFTVPFIWPLHETPYDEFRYTPYSLKRFLENAGFQDIVIAPMGDYNASLAQMLCIWIANEHNKKMSAIRKYIFFLLEKYILYRIIRKLLDQNKSSNDINFGENTISPGFYGYAKK